MSVYVVDGDYVMMLEDMKIAMANNGELLEIAETFKENVM